MRFTLPLLLWAVCDAAWAAPHLPVNPGGIGGLFKGPNDETIIRGPDGSVITAFAEGGAVKTDEELAVVAKVEEPATVAALAQPIVVESDVEEEAGVRLDGPSGSIATKGSDAVIAGPASTTIKEGPLLVETAAKEPLIVPTAAIVPQPSTTGAPLLKLTSIATPVTVRTSEDVLHPQLTIQVLNNGVPLAPPPVAPILANVAPVALVPEFRPTGVAPISDGVILDQQLLIDQKQIAIDPALIHPINIVPPEIRLVAAAAPELATSPPDTNDIRSGNEGVGSTVGGSARVIAPATTPGLNLPNVQTGDQLKINEKGQNGAKPTPIFVTNQPIEGDRRLIISSGNGAAPASLASTTPTSSAAPNQFYLPNESPALVNVQQAPTAAVLGAENGQTPDKPVSPLALGVGVPLQKAAVQGALFGTLFQNRDGVVNVPPKPSPLFLPQGQETHLEAVDPSFDIGRYSLPQNGNIGLVNPTVLATTAESYFNNYGRVGREVPEKKELKEKGA